MPRAIKPITTTFIGARGWLNASCVFVMLIPIYCYRLAISPLIGGNCRFSPTCSHYAILALRQHGALQGGYLAVKRILHCHPFGGQGYDPVPPTTHLRENRHE